VGHAHALGRLADYRAVYHEVLEQAVRPAAVAAGALSPGPRGWSGRSGGMPSTAMASPISIDPTCGKCCSLSPSGPPTLSATGSPLPSARRARRRRSVAPPVAARGYPSIILLEQRYWLAVQRDEEANLALSPEEGLLLESVRSAQTAGQSYPLFINGRAGSGKSRCCSTWPRTTSSSQSAAAPTCCPSYLTSSHDLLENARSVVRGLLTTPPPASSRGSTRPG